MIGHRPIRRWNSFNTLSAGWVQHCAVVGLLLQIKREDTEEGLSKTKASTEPRKPRGVSLAETILDLLSISDFQSMGTAGRISRRHKHVYPLVCTCRDVRAQLKWVATMKCRSIRSYLHGGEQLLLFELRNDSKLLAALNSETLPFIQAVQLVIFSVMKIIEMKKVLW